MLIRAGRKMLPSEKAARIRARVQKRCSVSLEAGWEKTAALHTHRPRPRGSSMGSTSLANSLSIHPSWRAIILHPLPPTEGSRRGFALCIPPAPSGLAFGEAQSSLLGGRQLQSVHNVACMPCLGLLGSSAVRGHL